MVHVTAIAYHTLGCKVNQYETEKIREELERAGLVTVPFSSPADAYIINTCSVTSVADGKSRAAVRRALRQNPDAYVIVAGCYAELEPGSIRAIEGVDLVVPNAEKDAIPERLVAHFAGSRLQAREEASGRARPERALARPRVRTRAVVKVQDGCDQFCSYCIVPHARNRKWSRRIDDVVAEVRALAKFGYKEVVLTGIRLGNYELGSGLPGLIRAVGEIDGIERIRLSSIEPWEVDDALLDAMQSSKVCRHLHIPLQSGDDSVLRRMNRPYTAAQYLQTTARVRQWIPGVGITTDVIVGFPGETEEAFGNTRRVIEEAGFSRLHVFRYSPRERTPAASMPDQIPAEVKKQRAENLIELGADMMRRFAGSMIGETLDVLVETQSKQAGTLVGFTDNYIETRLPGDSSLKGSILRVRVVGVERDGTAVGVNDQDGRG